MKELMAYACSYCAMVSRTKSSVVRHEKTFCKKSPFRKRCGLCKHYEYDPSNEYRGDYDPPDDPPYCAAKDEILSSFGANENNECQQFESKIN